MPRTPLSDGASGVGDASAVGPEELQEYTRALQRGAANTPEVWLRDRNPDSPPNPGALAAFRGIGLLVRHRRALGMEIGPQTPEKPAPGPSPVVMSGSAGAEGPASSPSLLDDSAWLAAHGLVPLGKLDVQQGGQGSIALAWHSAMHREVVLKMALGPEKVPRFEREIRVSAKLEGHPNIAVTRTPLRHGDAPVLVVDYVPGPSLRRYVKVFGPMPWRLALDCVRQAASGLAHAHALGVIHRDVKTSNLVRSARDGVVKLIDWGLALDRHSPEADPLTRGYLGTPAYCSPEQFEDATTVSTASDLYSLGCVLHELLTGSTPFERSLLGPSLAHRQEPVPPLASSLGVPRNVERILQKLLNKDPVERYPTAKSLIVEIDRATGGSGLNPRRVWIAASLLGLAGFFLWGYRSNRGVPEVTDLTDLTVELIDTGTTPTRSGMLGKSTYDARVGDQVHLRAKLPTPAYCYLLSFQPDGQVEVWFPSDPRARPSMTASPRFPVDADLAIDLKQGTGLQAFALIVSDSPLPDFLSWRAAQPVPPWLASIPADPGRVWVSDGQKTWTLEPSAPDPTRGTGSKTRAARGAVMELGRWLKARPGITHVSLKAFAVQPPH